MSRQIRPSTIRIRAAQAADGAALERLSQLDSSPTPSLPVLVAEEEGELRAALSLDGSRLVADPFARTAHLVEMLAIHASREADRDSSPRGRRVRVPRLGRRAAPVLR